MNRVAGDRRGFALLAALWLLVILSVLGLELGARSRARRLAAANVLETSRAASVAEAGIAEAHALLARRLVTTTESGASDPNRVVDPWGGCELWLRDTASLGEVHYSVSLEDVGASLNLNRATEEELRRLFIVLRVDLGRADRLAQSIMDWRDSDDLHRPRGAERDDYLRAGAAALPTNRPFDRLTELQLVQGMTPEIYRRIRPHLTLLGTGQVNLNSASRPVLLALPGLTEQAVGVIFRRRSGSRPLRSLEELVNELPSAPRTVLQSRFADLLARAAFQTREVMATSDAWLEGSPSRAVAHALFARGGSNVFRVWTSAQ